MNDDVYVSADQISRDFDLGGETVHALQAASFSIGPGEKIAIVGPSGSGKSTLLHILAGLDDPSAGSIVWPALGPKETLRPAQVGFLAQEQSLVSSLTVLENVELPLLFMNVPYDKAEFSARGIIEQLDLSELTDKLPDELSFGQMKRVAMARAFASRPKLLIADEPTGQLDHATARSFLDALETSLDGSDTALVLTTHDTEVARRMSGVWRMNHGILEVETK